MISITVFKLIMVPQSSAEFGIIIIYIIHSPQILTYYYYKFKKRVKGAKIDGEREFILKKIARIMVMPIRFIVALVHLFLVGFLSLCVPLVTWELPFVEFSEEIWKFNFYPTWYVILVYWSTTVNVLYVSKNMFEKGVDINEEYARTPE